VKDEWITQARELGREDAEAGNPVKLAKELREHLVAPVDDYATRQTFAYWWSLSDGQLFTEAYDQGYRAQPEIT
jgi:hypothetical protein